ncbi:glycoside hydrolase family 3 C-terminal domain-containing protein [Hymenobacter terrenus]|uniref:glycoside hydrolase family 3 C-terminal domain-containing protein n=1 Tax=Hymenobacter terrenus TaxID=1629124 RepID=UPI0006971A56|nr:glycoside hydrolase family 3 C-terminal domain-containing protein [Hymenobacter terrenus]
MKTLRITFWGLLLTGFLTVSAHRPPTDPPKYLNPQFSTKERVSDLVSRLTLKQKVKLLMYTGTAIDSAGLQVPAYNWWNECLHGVARAGKATVFPQSIGLAATWDPALAGRVASAISDEARAKYEQFSQAGKRGIYQGLNFWTPNINIFRDPRWGRGMETYGEDPLLTGQMAASFIKGIQGDNPKYYKAIATVKHFAVHSGPEATRSRFDAQVSDRDLYQTYTPAFKTCIQDAKAYSVMCAYNRFRGEPCCGSNFLLNNVLRQQWGFNGFIVTDCGAVSFFHKKGMHEVVPTPEQAAALAIKAGVDLECGSTFNALDKALAQKLVTEAELDVALKRLFTARFKLGFFDDPKENAYTKISYSTVESAAHVQLALETAQKSIVLLKNQNNTLPLAKTLKTLAVVGPNADDEEVPLANYHGFPSQVVTPLAGLRNRLPNTKVLYAKGSRHTAEVPSLDLVPTEHLFTTADAKTHGLTAEYFSNSKFEGKPALSRVDKNVDFYWINDLPVKTFDRQNFSVRWRGYLKAPVSGRYSLGAYGFDKGELRLNDSLLCRIDDEHEAHLLYKDVTLEAGKTYKLELRFASTKPAPVIKLKWEVPNQNLQAKALEICKKADAVVMCMGLSPRIEGEAMKGFAVDGFFEGDRTKLKLPDAQLELIQAVQALGKPVVLVLLNGSAVAVNWENQHLPAIVEAWYGGQQAGNALADVLTGTVNPSGRLPMTFYTSETQLPAFDNYDMKGRTYRYFTGQPLYEFGYGLSYTSFAYSGLKVAGTAAIGQPVTVSAVVKNTGKIAGDEIVQLYLANTTSKNQPELRTLKGFRRVSLKPGEQRTVTFQLAPADFSTISDAGQRVLNPDAFTISVGGRQPTKAAAGQFVTQTLTLTGTAQTLKL